MPLCPANQHPCRKHSEETCAGGFGNCAVFSNTRKQIEGHERCLGPLAPAAIGIQKQADHVFARANLKVRYYLVKGSNSKQQVCAVVRLDRAMKGPKSLLRLSACIQTVRGLIERTVK